MDAQFIFNPASSVTTDHSLLILDFPTPPDCCEDHVTSLKEQIINCNLRLDSELNQWILTYSFKKPLHSDTSCAHIEHKGIEFAYDTSTPTKQGENKKCLLTDRILCDFKGLVKLYQHALKVDGYLQGGRCCGFIIFGFLYRTSLENKTFYRDIVGKANCVSTIQRRIRWCVVGSGGGAAGSRPFFQS